MTTIVIGGSGGVGRHVMRLLPVAFDWSREPDILLALEGHTQVNVDLRKFSSIREATEKYSYGEGVAAIINCAGVNRIAPFDSLSPGMMEEAMTINAYGLYRVVQILRQEKLLLPGARICNVISNAAHIPMTHSLAYNASKAAQEMITRQMARELKEYSIFGVNPNKIEGTGMSRQIEKEVCALRGWSKEEARRYQLAALPAGVETPATSLARFIVDLMNPIHHPYITGCIFPYGGPQ